MHHKDISSEVYTVERNNKVKYVLAHTYTYTNSNVYTRTQAYNTQFASTVYHLQNSSVWAKLVTIRNKLISNQLEKIFLLPTLIWVFIHSHFNFIRMTKDCMDVFCLNIGEEIL